MAALLGPALSLSFRLGLDDVFRERTRLISFIPSIVIAAYLGGLRPGLLATASSALLGWYALLPPRYSFSVPSPVETANLAMFVAVSSFLCWISEQMHRAGERAVAAERETAKRTAEIEARTAELRESEQRLRMALQAAGAGSWEMDLATSAVHASPNLIQLFGFEESGDHKIDEYLSRIHPDDRARVAEASRLSAEGGVPHFVEYRIVLDRGEERWAASWGQPVRDASGRIARLLGTMMDVTVQRRAAIEREALLVSERAARAEAERANRMKDEFLAVVSHELRTPLSAILGWTGLLRRPDPAADQLGKGLAVIDRNTRLLVELISDLLDTSRIMAGKLHLDLRTLTLSTPVEAAIESVRSTAAAKAIEIHASIGSADAVVRGDPGRIQQIAQNLLSNAIKFTPKGGRVAVTVTPCEDRVELAVRDTGQGIAAEFLPHVFDRFRQADGGTTREHGGLGLGLSIVRSLVELHDGTVRVESAGRGEGTTFTVSLPCSAGRLSTERLSPLSGEATSLQGVRVLAVDDEQDMRELLERVLAEHGAAVSVAPSAEEALALLRGGAVDVLVSDIGMPGMDGYGLIQKVRGGDAGRASDVPAVALTAFARPEDRQRALSAGYQAHLVKPIDPAELVTVLASLAACH